MKNDLVEQAVKESGLLAGNLFKFAYEYSEVRISKQRLIYVFLEYHYHGVINEIVEDYCLEILSHRIVRQH